MCEKAYRSNDDSMALNGGGCSASSLILFNRLPPNDLARRRAVSPLRIKIPSKNMREKPTNTQLFI
jgi:hypothetical protein